MRLPCIDPNRVAIVVCDPVFESELVLGCASHRDKDPFGDPFTGDLRLLTFS